MFEKKGIPMILVIGGSFQGKKAFAEELCSGQILPDFHTRIRAALQAGEDPDALTRQILTDPPEVITLDEVGCGIVPLEKKERIYRDAVGHAGQMLAAAAEKVYRVQCGIATRIK